MKVVARGGIDGNLAILGPLERFERQNIYSKYIVDIADLEICLLYCSYVQLIYII